VYKNVRGSCFVCIKPEERERSCTRVLELVIVSVPSQKSESSSTRVLKLVIVSVPS
jgi:hypothetical protein